MRTSRSFPVDSDLQSYLLQQANASHSYAEVGASQTGFPTGYDHDYNRFHLGKGRLAFQQARRAIEEWRPFANGWTEVYPKEAPLAVGTTVAVLFRLCGLWWRNSTRIVYVVDEPDRFGFAYGTLVGHVERGEEYFGVEMDDEGEVWFRLEAFSRPAYWATRLTYPLARFFQRRFVRAAGRAMQAAVREGRFQAAELLV